MFLFKFQKNKKKKEKAILGSIQKDSQRNVLMYYKIVKNHNNYNREFKFIIIINLSRNFDFELKLIVLHNSY